MLLSGWKQLGVRTPCSDRNSLWWRRGTFIFHDMVVIREECDPGRSLGEGKSQGNIRRVGKFVFKQQIHSFRDPKITDDKSVQLQRGDVVQWISVHHPLQYGQCQRTRLLKSPYWCPIIEKDVAPIMRFHQSIYSDNKYIVKVSPDLLPCVYTRLPICLLFHTQYVWETGDLSAICWHLRHQS